MRFKAVHAQFVDPETDQVVFSGVISPDHVRVVVPFNLQKGTWDVRYAGSDRTSTIDSKSAQELIRVMTEPKVEDVLPGGF